MQVVPETGLSCVDAPLRRGIIPSTAPGIWSSAVVCPACSMRRVDACRWPAWRCADRVHIVCGRPPETRDHSFHSPGHSVKRCRVSGLFDAARRCLPPACMEMRGPGPYRFFALQGAAKAHWFPRSRLDDCLPLRCFGFSLVPGGGAPPGCPGGAEPRRNGAVELRGLPKVPGCIAAAVGAGSCCAEPGNAGGHAAARPGLPRQEHGKGRSAHSDRADGRESGAKSGREPLQVDRGGGQVGLDPHVAQAAPHGAAQPVPSLGLSVEPFRSPAVAPVEPPVLFAPSEPPPPGAQQRRMVGADHHRLPVPAPGNAVAPGRASRGSPWFWRGTAFARP